MDYKAKLGRNIKSLMEYRNDAWKCVRCGLCRMGDPEDVDGQDFIDNCPAGTTYGFELFYSAGKWDLIKCLTAEPPEIDEPTELMKKAIFTCTGCGRCQEVCNYMKGLEPMNAFQALKAYAIEKWGIKKEHNNLVQSILNYDNPWMAPRRTRAHWARKLDFKLKDATKEDVDILFFPGCNASYVPEIVPTARATANIMRSVGIDFGILGEKERCCGSTAFRCGAFEMFEKYKKQNIEQLNSLGIKTMVTACAGCHSTFSHNYAGDLDFEVVHVIEYVARLIDEGKIEFKNNLDMTLTYHDPCHIGRYGDIYEAPRKVLKALPGVTFNEMKRIKQSSMCCGSGGGVKTAYPEMALSVASNRLDEAKEAAGASTVVSCCPFCEINLGEAAKARQDGTKVVDIMELVEQAMKG
ncbi:MAG: (Fe-S)-binding protein [Desulfobacteraceae bacterium]|nr:(Fe-S)-binding protein [Desulfobacteraceae bacterium]MBC2756548.1 (Fe-S)-binding protein [Desulfobacteraceae bacterium]